MMTARHGSQPSYLWRSLLASRNLVATGNGLQIRIRDDAWIGLENTTKTSGLDRENHELQLVSDLIDETTIQWKEEEIRTMFCREEATKVLIIPSEIDQFGHPQRMEDLRLNQRITWQSAHSPKLAQDEHHRAIIPPNGSIFGKLKCYLEFGSYCGKHAWDLSQQRRTYLKETYLRIQSVSYVGRKQKRSTTSC
ncbi:hypothetical protein C2S51_013625 [Perilla frutescens var. frutescens]|nr:hypothetical protein C2S51_013625 [Perilla frutescens var. frutescens]